MTNRREVIQIAIHGDTQEGPLRELGETLRDRLLQREEITQVELGGVRDREIAVEIPDQSLRRHGLSLEQVALRIRRNAVQLPAGVVKTAGGEVLLRTDERRDHGRDFAELPILESPSGAVLRLGEIAEIKDGFSERDEYATFNGRRSVVVKAYRVGDQTPITVAGAVREEVAEFTRTLAPGLGVDVVADWSEIYRDRMELLTRNALWGLILVMVVLGLFLQPSLAFWVTLGIPISFLGAILLMPALNVSMNMISMFAFIVTLGIVVDDAIVIGENVYEKRQAGAPILVAAIAGAREVAMPVTFSVLTTVVAFTPMLFVPGFSGKLFGVIPLIVISVLVLSLVESLLILPAHLSHARRPGRQGLVGVLRVLLGGLLTPVRPLLAGMSWIQRSVSTGLERFIRGPYRQVLERSLQQRYLTTALGLAMLIVTIGYVAGGRIDFSFMPRIESDRVVGKALLPYGSPVERTEHVQKRLIDAAMIVLEELGGVDEVSRGIYAQLGRGIPGGGPAGMVRDQPGGHLTTVQVRLTPSKRRDFSAQTFVQRWREELGELAGVEQLSFKATIGASAGSPIDIQLSHRDVKVLETAAIRVAAALETYEGVRDLDTGFSAGKPQLDFELTTEARSLGLTTHDVARQVRSAFFGAEALRQQRGRDEVRVYVRRPLTERQSEYDVESLLIRTPRGGEIPLGVAARVERGRADNVINRTNGRRRVNVTADVDEKVANAGKILAGVQGDTLPALRAEFPGLTWSLEGEQRSQRETLHALGIGYLIAMMIILALLAVPFRSYIFQPLIVMAAIPFGLVGAVFGHVVMGFELSIISMMGIVALSGVVVNDSLVLIVAANRLRSAGAAPYEAITAAAVRRFRPILLTSLTTFFGLMPMILETSVQARFLVPMAVSLGYGVLFVTVIVLGLVPSFYLVVEDIRRLLGLEEEGEAGPEAHTSEPAVA
jgi:multidrug efflux pump subunit AcrB